MSIAISRITVTASWSSRTRRWRRYDQRALRPNRKTDSSAVIRRHVRPGKVAPSERWLSRKPTDVGEQRSIYKPLNTKRLHIGLWNSLIISIGLHCPESGEPGI